MNATLVINNSKQFCNDIWDENDSFTVKEWKTSIKGFADALQEAYDFLNQELYDENGKETFFPDNVLYQVGDVINLFRNIDVKIKKGA